MLFGAVFTVGGVIGLATSPLPSASWFAALAAAFVGVGVLVAGLSSLAGRGATAADARFPTRALIVIVAIALAFLAAVAGALWAWRVDGVETFTMHRGSGRGTYELAAWALVAMLAVAAALFTAFSVAGVVAWARQLRRSRGRGRRRRLGRARDVRRALPGTDDAA